jgi:protein-S-isoprenylcysteine O-methyltransferase Ste14
VIPQGLVRAVVVLAGATFIVFAQVARGRAVARRGPSLRVAHGIAQALPYFFWVPYVVVALGIGPQFQLPDAVVLLGVALAVGGVALAIWSIAALGRHYDLVLEIHAGHELVRSGPFRIVRHPVYTGLALHFIGACLATGNVLLAAGTLLVTLPTFVVRASAEERLLRERFGAAYDRYAEEVPRLVPDLRGAGRAGRRPPTARS